MAQQDHQHIWSFETKKGCLPWRFNKWVQVEVEKNYFASFHQLHRFVLICGKIHQTICVCNDSFWCAFWCVVFIQTFFRQLICWGNLISYHPSQRLYNIPGTKPKRAAPLRLDVLFIVQASICGVRVFFHHFITLPVRWNITAQKSKCKKKSALAYTFVWKWTILFTQKKSSMKLRI